MWMGFWKRQRLQALESMWRAVENDWTADVTHDAFITACVVADQSSLATGKYQRKLIEAVALRDEKQQTECYHHLWELERARGERLQANNDRIWLLLLAVLAIEAPDNWRFVALGALLLRAWGSYRTFRDFGQMLPSIDERTVP